MAAVPAFIIGMLLMLLFSLVLGWFPVSGIIHGWKSYVLPIVSLGIPYGAPVTLYPFQYVETVRQDYVRTARAKGASPRMVVWRHAMKRPIAVITVAGTSFGAMLGGAIAIENLFGLPGLGTYIADGIALEGRTAVMGGIIVYSCSFPSSSSWLISPMPLLTRIKAKYQQEVRQHEY